MKSNPFERILVPTDLSEFGNLALQYALHFREKVGSQITLLYAEEFTFLYTGDYPVGYYFENVTEVKKHTGELLTDYVQKHVPSTAPVATMLIDDTPARAIVMTADNVDADLIIMGTHGRHGLRRAFLGSVTERVLRETDRPVMTVAPQLFPAGAEVRIGKILCPVNFTEIARAALERACELAVAFGSELIVMHVSEPDGTPASRVEAEFSGWVDPLVRGRTHYQQILATGDAAAGVLEVADQIRAGLIVVGAQHRLFSDATVIGTTTERITRFAKQTVLTVVRRAVTQREQKHEQMAVVG